MSLPAQAWFDQRILRPVDISVILASHNEGANLRITVDAFRRALPDGSELIVVDDCSTDGSADFLRRDRTVRLVRPRERQGAAQARNVGARVARGDYLVFSDAHTDLEPGWFEPLCRALGRPGVGAVGPVISSMEDRNVKGFGHTWSSADLHWQWLSRNGAEPYAVPFVPAGFIALRRETFKRIGGFDRGLIVWGSIGDELSLRLWLFGAECQLVPEVEVAHLFRRHAPYQLEWPLVLHNMMRMAVLHFSAPRVSRLFAELAQRKSFEPALAKLLSSNAWRLRDRYRRLRVHDDDWFFERFGISVLDQPSQPVPAASSA